MNVVDSILRLSSPGPVRADTARTMSTVLRLPATDPNKITVNGHVFLALAQIS